MRPQSFDGGRLADLLADAIECGSCIPTSGRASRWHVAHGVSPRPDLAHERVARALKESFPSAFRLGCSGGGVLSSWVIGHTDRFAAAAVRCPVTNWLSFAGETDIPNFTYNFFQKPFWEDPMPWLKQSSLMYVGNVKTPTAVMTGVLDMRTPMAQSEEYYAALKMRGVPAVLFRFENEWHGTSSRPSNWMRTQLYMMSWYGKHKRPAEAVAESEEESS